MDQELISASELARRAGTAPSTVTRHRSGKLAAAFTDGKFDAQHPAVQAFIAERSDGPPRGRGLVDADHPHQPKPRPAGTGRPPGRPPKYAQEPPPPQATGEAIEIPEHLEGHADMTIREIVQRYGTLPQYEYFLKAVKQLEDVTEKKYKNAERRGELVRADYVQNHVVGFLDGLTQRLLNDVPKALVHRVKAEIEADTPTPEIEKMIVKVISKQIKGAKGNVQRRIKNARSAGE